MKRILQYSLKGKLSKLVGSLARDRRGDIVLIAAFSLPVLLVLVGGTVDYARVVALKSQLQDAADVGVLTGGNALKLAGSDIHSVEELTKRTIRDAAHASDDTALQVTAQVLQDNGGVQATAQQNVKLFFGGLIGVKHSVIKVNARANLVGKMRLCMLTLDPLAAGAISLQSDARVTAENCSLYANSTSPRALVGEASAIAKAETICSAGGVDGPRANFQPAPRTECPAVKDPLNNRQGPAPGPCKGIPTYSSTSTLLTSLGYDVGTHQKQLGNLLSLMKSKKNRTDNNGSNSNGTLHNKISQSVVLEPGTYCGGLLITGNAVVTLLPGNYVIKDGPLLVDKKATLIGNGVSLHFIGDAAGLLFNTDTTISLTAPVGGTMSGILLSDAGPVSNPVDPASFLNAWNASLGGFYNCPLRGPPVVPSPPPLQQTSPTRIYRIISNNTRQMHGTIHLPAGRLVLDGERPVADQSHYTVVVAQQVNLYKGPNLVLNANYDRSNIPVPTGVGPIAGQVHLTQ